MKSRSSELTLAAIGLAGGIVALAVATGGNLLSRGTLAAFFQFLAVPIVIGLSQMVTLAIGQMNLSVGALTAAHGRVLADDGGRAAGACGILGPLGVGLGAAVVNGLWRRGPASTGSSSRWPR